MLSNKNLQKVQISITIAQQTLLIHVPLHWSVNKLKCFLTTVVPTLNFDAFQFLVDNHLVYGEIIIESLYARMNQKICFSVVKTDCTGSFQRYYKRMANKFLDKAIIGNFEPLLSTDYLMALKNINNLHHNVENNHNENFFLDEEENNNILGLGMGNGFGILTIFRFIGMAFIINFFYSNGQIKHFITIAAIVVVYYLIDKHMRDVRNRRREQIRFERRNAQNNLANQPQAGANQPPNAAVNQPPNAAVNQPPQPEQIIENQENLADIKRNQQHLPQEQQQNFAQKQLDLKKNGTFLNRILLYFVSNLCSLIEIIYCYVVSLFPNWTIEYHLEAHRQKIIKVEEFLKRIEDEKQEAKDDKTNQIIFTKQEEEEDEQIEQEMKEE